MKPLKTSWPHHLFLGAAAVALTLASAAVAAQSIVVASVTYIPTGTPLTLQYIFSIITP